MRANILVSACLMGHAVRYDGRQSRLCMQHSIAGEMRGGW